MSCIPPQANKSHPEAALLIAGDFNAGKLKLILPNFYQHVKCASEENKFWTTFTPHTETHAMLSLTLHLANLTIILSSLQAKIKEGSTRD
jgi:hypothetical protein